MGTEEFWIPAVVSMVGTAAQAVNTRQANNAQDASETQAIIDQQKLQSAGAGAANKLTREVAADNPSQIAAKSTGDYVAALRKNASAQALDQGGSTSSLSPVAGANSRYGQAVSAGDKAVQDYGNTYASDMGNIDAAIRQRQNEGNAMGTLNTTLNGLNAQSNSTNFVDQLRSQVAGQPNPWVSLFSALAKNGANAYALNAKGPPITTTVAPPLDSGNWGYGMPTGAHA